MKWLLISTVVIIFGGGCILADESETEFCLSHRIHQANVQKKCITNFINLTEFQDETRDILFEYSGNDSAVLEFAQKNCPIGRKVVNCLPLMLNIPDECHDPQYYFGHFLNFRIMGVIVEFLCENNAEALLEMMSNDGFKNIVLSETTNECMNQLKEVPMLDANSEINQINPLYCEALGKAAKCYSTAVQINENTNLPRLLNRFYVNVREVVGCV